MTLPDNQILGAPLLMYQRAAEDVVKELAEVLIPAFQRHGLGDIQPQEWYPARTAMEAIAEALSAIATRNQFRNVEMLVAWGGAAVQPIIDMLPPEATAALKSGNISDVVEFLAQMHKQVFRGPGVGTIELSETPNGTKQAIIKSTTISLVVLDWAIFLYLLRKWNRDVTLEVRDGLDFRPIVRDSENPAYYIVRW